MNNEEKGIQIQVFRLFETMIGVDLQALPLDPTRSAFSEPQDTKLYVLDHSLRSSPSEKSLSSYRRPNSNPVLGHAKLTF